MNVVNRIRYRGWLAPGIVLNAVATGNVRFTPNNFSDSALFVPNVAESQAIQLSGKVLSVCWMIPLTNYAWLQAYPDKTVRHDGFDRLNPFADPCVLAAPCLFDGEILVVSGDDVSRIEFALPSLSYDSETGCAMTHPVLPAVYIPTSVGVPVIVGIDKRESAVMEELYRSWNYTPVQLQADSPSVTLYGSALVAPFIGLQRYKQNLAGLFVVHHGSPQHPAQVYDSFHLRVGLDHAITVDDKSVQTVLFKLQSQETFTVNIREPFPRQVFMILDFFKSGTGSGAPVFVPYLVPGMHQAGADQSSFDSILNMV